MIKRVRQFLYELHVGWADSIGCIGCIPVYIEEMNQVLSPVINLDVPTSRACILSHFLINGWIIKPGQKKLSGRRSYKVDNELPSNRLRFTIRENLTYVRAAISGAAIITPRCVSLCLSLVFAFSPARSRRSLLFCFCWFWSSLLRFPWIFDISLLLFFKWRHWGRLKTFKRPNKRGIRVLVSGDLLRRLQMRRKK